MLATGAQTSSSKPDCKRSLSLTHSSQTRHFPSLPALFHTRPRANPCSAPVSPVRSPASSRPATPRPPQPEILVLVDARPPSPLSPSSRSKPVAIANASRPTHPSRLNQSHETHTSSSPGTPQTQAPFLSSSLPSHLPSVLSSRENPFFASRTGTGKRGLSNADPRRPKAERQATPAVVSPARSGRAGGAAEMRVGGWIATGE